MEIFFFLNVLNGLTNFNFSTGVIQACWKSRSAKNSRIDHHKLPGPWVSTGVCPGLFIMLVFLEWLCQLSWLTGPSKHFVLIYPLISNCVPLYLILYVVLVFISVWFCPAAKTSSPCQCEHALSHSSHYVSRQL